MDPIPSNSRQTQQRSDPVPHAPHRTATPRHPPAPPPPPRSNHMPFRIAMLIVFIGMIYTVLNTVSFGTLSSTDAPSIGQFMDATPNSDSVRPTRYIEPTNSPRATATQITNTNTPVSNLQRMGNGQCPVPSLSSQLTPAQIAVANDALRLRAEPSIHADILGNVRPAELVTLLQGPVCSYNWIWWQVRRNDNQVGWVVEIGRGGQINGGGIYLLLPEGSELGPEANRAD